MDQPPGFTPLYGAQEMRAVDRTAIEAVGIPGIVLMERAGIGAADIIQSFYRPCSVGIVCGSGNNGGDGFVVARELGRAGYDVSVLLVESGTKSRRDARTNLEIIQHLGMDVERVNVTAWSRRLEDFELIIDALLGTGIEGAPKPAASAVIESVNRSGKPVISLDIPSGVQATTGEVPTVAVEAARTITFHAPKAGLLISPGRFHAGDIHVIDIGIPTRLDLPAGNGLVQHDVVGAVPTKSRSDDKYSAGRVVVVGGATGMAGAVSLASQAVLRAGAGIAWAVVPDSIANEIDAAVPEVQFTGQPSDDEGRMTAEAAAVVLEKAGGADTVVFGPGMGRSDGTVDLLRAVAETNAALVIDADGLWALSRDPDLLEDRSAATLLTPHAAELARLLDRDKDDVEAHRLVSVREAAERFNATVLLKGEDTITADPDGSYLVTLSPTSSATAGSGDVLAGIAGAIMAKGVAGKLAGACASAAHAEASGMAALQASMSGVLASDLLVHVPAALVPAGDDDPRGN